MEKEFIVPGFNLHGEHATISRADYENMPCSMAARDWTDEQMLALADAIAQELKNYSFDVTSNYYEEDLEEAFWKEMEDCAVRMGMQYYEDL